MSNAQSSNAHFPADHYQCRHIFPDGDRCGSPRMRNEDRCYYHHETRGPIRDPYQRQTRRGTFAPLPPTSFSAIQESLDQVLVRIASNDLDLRRAGLLLYCLQIASTNLRHAQKTQQNQTPTSEANTATSPQNVISTEGGEDAEVERPLYFVNTAGHPTQRGNQPEPTASSALSIPAWAEGPGSVLPNLSASAGTPANNRQPTTSNRLQAARYRPRTLTIRQCSLNASTASSATAGESNRTST